MMELLLRFGRWLDHLEMASPHRYALLVTLWTVAGVLSLLALALLVARWIVP